MLRETEEATLGQPLADVPALIVPGIGDSGPGHWQTIWEAQHPHWRRVEQRDWHHPRCNECLWVGCRFQVW